MATETGPDLSAGQRAVELLMDDTVRASAATDPAGWVLNAALRLEPPADSVVYDGKAKLRALGSVGGTVAGEGGRQYGLDGYRLDLPLSAAELLEGQTVALTSSRRMPQAVGDLYVVKAPLVKTMAVQASYIVERRKRVE